jgi:hypothetical protein
MGKASTGKTESGATPSPIRVQSLARKSMEEVKINMQVDNFYEVLGTF